MSHCKKQLRMSEKNLLLLNSSAKSWSNFYKECPLFRGNSIVISIYEVISVIMNEGGILTEFAPWAKHLIVINTLLVVFNSSSNFILYCGDVVFRECLAAMSFANCSCHESCFP
eukprot:TCALIF_06664-PA protein Name:"Protein of unknown function" AED:0.06 eAED:0.36 QI:0/0/0/0.66/0/0.33/3/0/113